MSVGKGTLVKPANLAEGVSGHIAISTHLLLPLDICFTYVGLPKFGPEPQFEPRTPEPNLRFGPVLVLVLSSGAGSVHGSSLGS